MGGVTILRAGGWLTAAVVVVVVLMVGAGCGRGVVPEGRLVLTQVPVEVMEEAGKGKILDQRYPAGTRVVLAPAPGDSGRIQILSRGLLSAGGPVLSPCGQEVLFSGKAAPEGAWQIYRARLRGGKPQPLTSMEGGAMDPAYLPDGRFVFSSPVPELGADWRGEGRPMLWTQPFEKSAAQRLTHGLAGAVSPTVLRDGRVLFVSGGSAALVVTNQSLFTVNNDGTELTAYGGQNDGMVQVWNPRELSDGRIVFLSAEWETGAVEGRVEQVYAARPFSSRQPAWNGSLDRVRSIEEGRNGDLLIAARGIAVGGEGRFGVYRVANGAGGLVEPWLDDPNWHEVEALFVRERVGPMGRLSTVKPDRTTGALLCLDANDTMLVDGDGSIPRATRIRLLKGEGRVEVLGETRLQRDGSFMVQVPADTPIGFEALDDEGRVLRRLAPTVWVRPGENRACVGCHEPRNTSPENHRPLAVKEPIVTLEALLESIGQR